MDYVIEGLGPEKAAEKVEVSPHTPWLEFIVRQNASYVLGLTGFLALAVLIAYYVPPLVRSDVYNNDMCEHISWYHAAKNPALFQDDIMKTYFMAMCPLGYKALFSVAGKCVDPQTLGEVLSLVLGGVAILLAYKVGEVATGGTIVGGISSVLLLLFGQVLGLGQFIKVFEGG